MAATDPLRKQSSSSSVFTQVSVASSVRDGVGEARRMVALQKQLGSMLLGHTHAQRDPSPKPLQPPKKRSNMEGSGSYVDAAATLNAFFGNLHAKKAGVVPTATHVRVPSPTGERVPSPIVERVPSPVIMRISPPVLDSVLENHGDAPRIPPPPPMPHPLFVAPTVVIPKRRTAPPPPKQEILAPSLVSVPVTTHEIHLAPRKQVTFQPIAMHASPAHSPVSTPDHSPVPPSEVVSMAELNHVAGLNPLVLSTRLPVLAKPHKPPSKWGPQGVVYNRTMQVFAAVGTTLAIAGVVCLFVQPHVAIAILIAAAVVGGLAALLFVVKGLDFGCRWGVDWLNNDERPVWYWKHTPRRIVVSPDLNESFA